MTKRQKDLNWGPRSQDECSNESQPMQDEQYGSDISLDLSKKEKMYTTPEGLLDEGHEHGMYKNHKLSKFYADKKEAYEQYLNDEKKVKSE